LWKQFSSALVHLDEDSHPLTTLICIIGDENMSLFSRISLTQAVPQGGLGTVLGEQRKDAGGNRSNVAATGITNKLKEDAANTGSVLLKTLKPGDITNYPKKGNTCTIHYEAFLEDDLLTHANPEPFDSSRSRNQPFQFRLGMGQVIEGIDFSVASMSVGQEVQATIPFSHAYGIAGYPPVIPPRSTLVFRIELIRFSAFKN